METYQMILEIWRDMQALREDVRFICEQFGETSNRIRPQAPPVIRPPAKALLTLDEAAVELRVARSTLNAWIARGTVHVVRFSYKKVFIRPIDIEKAKERCLESGRAGKRRKN